MTNATYMVPKINEDFVPCENYADMKTIIKSGKFLPFMIVGPTGSGKTLSVTQVHAEMQKPIFRVNITSESDEDSLMGGFRLKDGDTVFSKGPVVQAMEAGATLLLDEIDLGSPNKIMCLQSVLEGEGYLIKRTGEFITPAPGFNVVGSANTKMAGDDSGQYIATQILNEAFRDRFVVTFEHGYPKKEQEKKILEKFVNNHSLALTDSNLEHMVLWAEKTREDESSDDGKHMNLDACISTRRLVDVAEVFSVFGDLRDSVKKVLTKYDSDYQVSFLQMWDLVDPAITSAEVEEDDDDDDGETIVF